MNFNALRTTRLRKHFSQDLLEVWIIATSSFCLGLFINELRDQPLPLVYASKQQRMDLAITRIATETGPESDTPQNITLAAFQRFLTEKRGTVLDARPEIFHRLGHIPGALSLPREDFEKSYIKNKSTLESNKNRPIAVYCSGSNCEDSMMVAVSLTKLGYRRVFVFKGGWAEWQNNHLPEEAQ